MLAQNITAQTVSKRNCITNEKIACAGRSVFGECASREEALWTFDTSMHSWQQQHLSGALPVPHLTCGLAVLNGCAYLLVNQPNYDSDCELRMEMYELNL